MNKTRAEASVLPARSVSAITPELTLPDKTSQFTGHDYMPGGREPRREAAVAFNRAVSHQRSNRSLDSLRTRQILPCCKLQDAGGDRSCGEGGRDRVHEVAG